MREAAVLACAHALAVLARAGSRGVLEVGGEWALAVAGGDVVAVWRLDGAGASLGADVRAQALRALMSGNAPCTFRRGAEAPAEVRGQSSVPIAELLCSLAPLDEPGAEQGCALLVRKKREMLRGAGARTLLGLERPVGAGQAGRALRRFAREIHPDRLAHDAPHGVRSAAHEVMGALTGAERTLRGLRHGG